MFILNQLQLKIHAHPRLSHLNIGRIIVVGVVTLTISLTLLLSDILLGAMRDNIPLNLIPTFTCRPCLQEMWPVHLNFVRDSATAVVWDTYMYTTKQ